MKGTSLKSNPDLVKTKPEQVPQVKKGEQVLQSLSLWSCEWLSAYSVFISSLQLSSSEQQGTVERERTYNDNMKQSNFINVNIINICCAMEKF
jgi:hypothetical protein